MKTRKPQRHKVVRVNISVTPLLYDVAQEVFRHGGYQGMSDFVATKLREELRSKRMNVTK